MQHDPEGVAHHANNPVNEADLIARHIWLVNQGAERVARIQGDPDYYDSKVAGWWVWGICCWIAGGWCSGRGPWSSVDGKLTNTREITNSIASVKRQRIHLSAGMGVNRQRVHLGRGSGVNRQLVHLGGGSAAMPGVLRKNIHDLATPCGVNTGEAEIYNYLSTLAERLRYVRVCCGDWKRVVTKGALSHFSTIGVFLDPPYNQELRDKNIYNWDDSADISSDVREWCIANGDNPRYRICLAGYEDEHTMPDTWRVVRWTASLSYGHSTSSESPNQTNRKKERLWFSPHCIQPSSAVTLQNELFAKEDNK